MAENIIIKTFRTYKHSYLYDRHTNSLVMLTDEEYEELQRVERKQLSANESSVVARFQQQGMLMPNVVKKIEHPATLMIEHFTKTRLKQLILQVTQQCNLRCSYCVYSGNYSNSRIHSNNRMSFETAKQAIDFFLDRNHSLKTVVIGFYGGEPLLEFELIKKCVEYANSCVEGRNILYTITTNGTLLNDEIIAFLIRNNFSLAISLDGSKEEHDANRKYANGRGSFETIIHNIEIIKNKYPEFSKNISILTTMNPDMDLKCSSEFFSVSEAMQDKHIIFSSVKETGLKTKGKYTEEYRIVRQYERFKAFLVILGRLDKSQVSPLALSSVGGIKHIAETIRSYSCLNCITHHNGPCLPGIQRLFVRVDGVLFPCERVGEGNDFFHIGSIKTGFDIDQVNKILNIGKLTEKECIKCWNLRKCSLCAGEIDSDGELSRADKLKSCNSSLYETEQILREMCVLHEFGIDYEGLRIQ